MRESQKMLQQSQTTLLDRRVGGCQAVCAILVRR